MCHNNSPSADDASFKRSPLEIILYGDEIKPLGDAEQLQDIEYQHHLRLILALTGHPDHSQLLEQPTSANLAHLESLQCVIDELHSRNQFSQKPPMSRATTLADGKLRNVIRSRWRRVCSLAASLMIAVGTAAWILNSSPTQESGTSSIVTVSSDSQLPGIETIEYATLKTEVRTECTSTDSLVLAYLHRVGLSGGALGAVVATRQSPLSEATSATDQQWQTAVEDVERTLESLERQRDKSVADLVTLGNWNLYRRRTKTAEEYFHAAIAQSRDLPEAWVGLALIATETLPDAVTSQVEPDLQGWMKARLEARTADAIDHCQSIQRLLAPFITLAKPAAEQSP